MWVPLIVFTIVSAVAFSVSEFQFSWFHLYVSIAWSVFAAIAVVDLIGMLYARKVIATGARVSKPLPASTSLVVWAVTKGAKQNVPSLRRVVNSALKAAPAGFSTWWVLIVTEEPPVADGLDEIYEFVDKLPQWQQDHVKLLVRPKEWGTPNGTRFKARANQYALENLKQYGLVNAGVWNLHMDDDTAIATDTARSIAAFVRQQEVAISKGQEPRLLAQGVLTYLHQCAHNTLLWLADSIRTGDDLARFAFFTGLRGTPIAGLHGELLLVRSDIEEEIGWDFGPNELTEDARLAMIFARRYKGKSGWFAGRCYGAPPANVPDFITQRRRWAHGLLNIAFDRSVPLAQRWLLTGTMTLWALAMFQNIIVIIPLAFWFGGGNSSPVVATCLVLWCLGMTGTVTKYWEGLRANAHASGFKRPKFSWKIMLLIGLYFFAVIEAIPGFLGLGRFLRQRFSDSRLHHKFYRLAVFLTGWVKSPWWQLRLGEWAPKAYALDFEVVQKTVSKR